MAIWSAEVKVDLHEVSLKNKPTEMLAASPKGTVPVLCLPNKVIDESLEIMRWALAINDPECWLSQYSDEQERDAYELIDKNDFEFKSWLDKYKYAVRFPEHPESYYRARCVEFLAVLEHRLEKNNFLSTNKLSFLDVAIFPFVRQFSMVDIQWFETCEYRSLRSWLDGILGLALFKDIMRKN